jgi:hypothetical protein
MVTTVCLNMIVRNEAANIERCLAAAAPFVDAWVICDTGSTDDTIERVRCLFAARGIPGEIHEFPFVNWEQARNEALNRARASALPFDYLLFADADMELVIEDPDLRSRLTEHAYMLRQQNTISYFNTRLVRRDVPSRYVGVTHEYVELPRPALQLEGAWFIDHASGSNRAGKFERDARLLEADLKCNPDNPRNVFYLAQSYRDAGRLNEAIEAYRRRAAMGGWAEEVWFSLYQVARLAEARGAPDAEVEMAYLVAFQNRPSRAEPLVQLARRHRMRNEWALASMFADAAAAIGRPDDTLFLDEGAYRHAALDEAAIAAYWRGNRQRSFELCWKLLDEDRVPEEMRSRIEGNAEFSAEAVATKAGEYPEAFVQWLAARAPEDPGREAVTLTVTTCKRLDRFERTINSFLNCCSDIKRIGRFVCIDDNSSEADRARMRQRYPFFEFIFKRAEEKGHARSMNRLLDLVDAPYWLHLEDDWNFAVTTDYVTRAISILDAEPVVAQVAFNRNYAERFCDRTVVGGTLHRLPESGLRYVLHEHIAEKSGREAFFRRFPSGALSHVHWPHFTFRPSIMRVDAIRRIGRFDEAPGHFELAFAQRFTEAGLRTAFFDAICCIHIGRLTSERGGDTRNAYELNDVPQF